MGQSSRPPSWRRMRSSSRVWVGAIVVHGAETICWSNGNSSPSQILTSVLCSRPLTPSVYRVYVCRKRPTRPWSVPLDFVLLSFSLSLSLCLSLAVALKYRLRDRRHRYLARSVAVPWVEWRLPGYLTASTARWSLQSPSRRGLPVPHLHAAHPHTKWILPGFNRCR